MLGAIHEGVVYSMQCTTGAGCLAGLGGRPFRPPLGHQCPQGHLAPPLALASSPCLLPLSLIQAPTLAPPKRSLLLRPSAPLRPRALPCDALLHLEYAHVAPAVGEFSDALPQALGGHEVLHDEEVKFLAKGEEVGEQRVEVRLDGEMDHLLKVRVVEVRKDTKEMLVDVFRGVRE